MLPAVHYDLGATRAPSKWESEMYTRASSVPVRSLPVSTVGTAGAQTATFFIHQYGYRTALIFVVPQPTQLGNGSDFSEMMKEIKTGFGRTLSRLPGVFGVSRQALYNWLYGDAPKATHQEKIRQLAEAARVLSSAKLKLDSGMLDRVVSNGKPLLQLLAEGANGRDAAEKFVRLVQRGAASREKLDALLGRPPSRLQASDIGAPALDEDL